METYALLWSVQIRRAELKNWTSKVGQTRPVFTQFGMTGKSFRTFFFFTQWTQFRVNYHEGNPALVKDSKKKKEANKKARPLAIICATHSVAHFVHKNYVKNISHFYVYVMLYMTSYSMHTSESPVAEKKDDKFNFMKNGRTTML
jgi:hypothetical protein